MNHYDPDPPRFSPQAKPVVLDDLTQPAFLFDEALFQTDEEASSRWMAERLGIEFLETVDCSQIVARDDECLELLRRPNPQVWAHLDGRARLPSVVIAPSAAAVSHVPGLERGPPSFKSRVRIASCFKLRAALLARAAPLLTRLATNGLFDAHPAFSARLRFSSSQAVVFGVMLLALPLLFWFFFAQTVLAIHMAATAFFFGCASLRLAAAIGTQQSSGRVALAPKRRDEPVYSVLVALRHEANVVPQLLMSLGELVWPRDRLEIKLICEADDRETIEAIRAHPLRGSVEVIEVPTSQPRTKPKALRYALPVTRGEFVVLYDAEDIPHPLQLQEAWRRFDNSDRELACLQAPLEVSNRDASWIARLFAFEYAALFRGLLPWLAAKGAVLPLGGTSNHFRRDALEEVGAWDPHNVTEDADLGIRLARFGYRAETIACPTFEDGPESFGVWRPQRTRWSKGWLQTWLVHMRSPLQLMRDLGLGSFLITQLLLFGMVLSALIHPTFIAAAGFLVWSLHGGITLSALEVGLIGVDLFNILCGYLGFLCLGWRCLGKNEKWRFWQIAVTTPVYWLMMSYAAWIAVRDLWLKPFHWDKTPHRPVRRFRPDRAL